MPTPSSRGRARVPADDCDDPKTWPVRRTTSAGGVVVRETGTVLEIAMTKRRTLKGAEAWGLPKGGLEDGETPQQAALREVREETGLEAEIVSDLGSITYWFAWPPDRARYRKTVYFFLMRMTGGRPDDHDDEVEEVGFIPVASAVRRASYGSERKVLKRAVEAVRDWPAR